MFRWITKSRLRTALAILFFVTAFLLSLFLWYSARPAAAPSVSEDTSVPSQSAAPAGLNLSLQGVITFITAVVSIIGTFSTVILAWRADRRSARESDLKLLQMQQQIIELEQKLTVASASRTDMV